ncbi:MAG TPA: DUF309 domain-containing protein [Chthoniobacterales bacterium]
MKKSDRISEFVKDLAPEAESEFDRCYLGYFACFNRGEYYEAHDVLEHLWLKNRDENHRFFKGLIQVAGAFVHLQKQYRRPDHPKDGRRLYPAVRLFALGMENLAGYRPRYLGLDLENLFHICEQHTSAILATDFSKNPWSPQDAPHLELHEFGGQP